VHIVVVAVVEWIRTAMQLAEKVTRLLSSTKNRDAFRRLHHFHGKTIVGSGFDRDVLFQADARRANALAAVDAGTIRTSSVRASPRQLRNQERRGAHLRPARATLHEARHPEVATALWTTQQVKRWLLPADDSVEWTASSARCTCRAHRPRRTRGQADQLLRPR